MNTKVRKPKEGVKYLLPFYILMKNEQEWKFTNTHSIL